MPSSIQIMLVEDSPEYRDTISLAAKREAGITISSIFGTAEEAIKRLENTGNTSTPTLILLDLNLPGLSGIKAIPLLAQVAPGIPIIALTQSDREADVLAAISAGASGYLLKDSTRQQIFEGIRIVADGGSIIDSQVASYLFKAIKKPSEKNNLKTSLAARELEILKLIAKGKAQKEISEHLNISSNTVATYLRRIYDKLNVHNAPEAVAKAYQEGTLPR